MGLFVFAGPLIFAAIFLPFLVAAQSQDVDSPSSKAKTNKREASMPSREHIADESKPERDSDIKPLPTAIAPVLGLFAFALYKDYGEEYGPKKPKKSAPQKPIKSA